MAEKYEQIKNIFMLNSGNMGKNGEGIFPPQTSQIMKQRKFKCLYPVV